MKVLMWTLWGMKLLSCSYVVSFTKNCWTNIWSFPRGDRGPQRQLKTQKNSSSCTLQLWVLQSKDIKDYPIHADGLIHLHPWRSSSFPRNIFLWHRNQRLIPPRGFNLFLLGLVIKVDTCTYHTSYNVCPIGSTRRVYIYLLLQYQNNQPFK